MKLPAIHPRGRKCGILVKGQWMTFDDQASALTKARELALTREHAKMARMAGAGITMDAPLAPAIAHYLHHLNAQSRRPRYITKIRIHLDKLLTAGIAGVHDVTPDAVMGILGTLDGKPAAKTTTTKCVKSFLKFCRDIMGYRIHPGTLKLPNPVLTSPERRLLTDDEVQRIMDASGERPEVWLAWYVMSRFGLRPSEFISLNVEHFCYQNTILTIPGTITKTRKTRQFPVGEDIASHIVRIHPWWKDAKPFDPLFVNPVGNRFNWTVLKRWWDDACLAAEITERGEKLDLYLLRHYAANRIFFLTRDLKTVSSILGHTASISLAVYQHRDHAAMLKVARDLA